MSPVTPDLGDSDGPYTFPYNAERDCQPTLARVEAMAWVKDADRLDHPPLYEAIDTERLNGLFGQSETGILCRSSSESEPTDHTLSFEYEGCDVEVTPDEILIQPA